MHAKSLRQDAGDSRQDGGAPLRRRGKVLTNLAFSPRLIRHRVRAHSTGGSCNSAGGGRFIANSAQTMFRSTILLLLALLASPALQAQVPQFINYQGRVAVGSTQFDGTGKFRFALVNATGAST